MDASFIEEYETLSSMQVGEIAVSKDRKKIFIKAQGLTEGGCVEKVLINLNDIHDQYLDQEDKYQPIRKLLRGDQFVITV
jgi:hypothetical protein